VAAFPAGDFRSWIGYTDPKEISGGKLSYGDRDSTRFGSSVFARGEEISLDAQGMFGFCLVASSGDVRVRGNVVWSVIIAGGNVTLDRGAGSAIIVCDGDVEMRDGVGDNCLIVTRGKVTGKTLKCVIRAEDYFQDAEGKKVAMKEGTADPFGSVKFFEAADVGLAIADRDGKGEPLRDSICLKEVGKGSLFSSALQAGDVVTAIDGKKAPSQEAFRKLLRRQLARGGPRITFTVLRAGQTSTVSVPVKD
jgi:hypothetical protein